MQPPETSQNLKKDQLDVLELFALCVIVSYGVAWRDVKLSAKMMLVFEGVSIFFILGLGIIIWIRKGFAIDVAQLTLKGATPGGVITGIVLAVFGFSGLRVPPLSGTRRRTLCGQFRDHSFRAQLYRGFFSLHGLGDRSGL